MVRFFLLFFVVVGITTALAQGDTLHIESVSIVARESASGRFVVDSIFKQSLVGKNLAELLRVATPVQIKNYGRGQKQSVVFRGTSNQHTSLYWNGLKVNSPVVGDVDFSFLPAFGIDRLNVAPGVSAIAYDNGALGGVVDMDSRADWGRVWGVDVVGGVGSFNSYNAGVGVRVTSGRVHSSTKVIYGYSLNDFEFVNRDIIDPVNPDYRPVQTNIGGDYQNAALIQDVFVRLPESQSLMVSVMLGDNWRNLPQLTTYEGAVNSHKTHSADRSLMGVVSYKNSLQGGGMVEAIIGGVFQGNDFLQEHLVSEQGDYLDYINSTSSGCTFQGQVKYLFPRLGGHKVYTTFQGQYAYAKSRESVRGAGFERGRGEFSFLGGWDASWNEALSSVVLVRGGVVGKRWNGSGSASLEYSPSAQVSYFVRGGYNQHFPSLTDLYYTPGGNPDLKPERGFTGEVAGLFRFLGVELNSNIFLSYIYDWIIWLPSHSQYWSPQNLKEVLSFGFELQFSGVWDLGGRWRLNGAGSATLSRTMSAEASFNSSGYSFAQQLPFVPLISGSASIEVEWANLSLGYTIQGESEKYSATNTSFSSLSTIESYLLHSLQLGYTPWKFLHIALECQNILNSQYYGILRRPMPPRSFMLNLGLKLGKNL